MKDHAVVIGGSISGLTAARVLADHFRQVTVVERDRHLDLPSPRRGVPQSRHVHFVLARGREELERLFPALATDLLHAGAVSFDYGRGARLLFPGGWLPAYDSELVVRGCTRPLIDWHLRRYVMAMPTVRIRDGCSVSGLIAGDDRRRVRGVTIKSESNGEEHVDASLVVDASGRGSKVPAWLKALGYPPARESVVDSGLKYCCRLYARPRDTDFDWKMISALSRPPDQPRSGVIFPVEGERWIACVATMGQDSLPANDEGFLPFFKTLSTRQLHEVLQSTEALSPVFRTGRTPNRLRHFEKMRRWPEGLVVLGDAVCALNPIYGQGITIATLGAVLLGAELGAAREPFAHGFQRKLARQSSDAWRLAVGSDLMWRTTRGTMLSGWKDTLRQNMVPALSAFSRTITTAAVHDPRVARVMMEVMHLVRPVSSMARPSVLMRIGAALVTPRRTAAEYARPGEERAGY